MPLTILLRCRDVEETREFYQSALGFNVRDTADGTLTAEYHGGVLIFTSGDLWETPLGFSGTIYFTVPDADGYFAAVKDKASSRIRVGDFGHFLVLSPVCLSGELA